MNDAAKGAGAPKSFWIISAVSLLWNAFGGFDYTMTKLRDPGYLANFPPEMMPYLDAMPVWASVLWALGVWGALAGSILLLLRSRHAVAAFFLSMIAALGSFAYQFGGGMPASMRTSGFLGMTAVIIVSVVFFWWYARKVRAQGFLR